MEAAALCTDHQLLSESIGFDDGPRACPRRLNAARESPSSKLVSTHKRGADGPSQRTHDENGLRRIDSTPSPIDKEWSDTPAP